MALAGLAAGAQLEHLAEQDQRGDHRGGLEVDRRLCRRGRGTMSGKIRGQSTATTL